MNTQKKEGQMSEDDVSRSKKEFDKNIETAMAQLDILFAKKEKEISN
jgi:ribosome recycling factor